MIPQSPATSAELTVQALLNCLVREVCGPAGQVREDSGHLLIRLPRSGVLLRARLRRPSAGLGPRLSGEAEEHGNGRWAPAGWQRLTDLVAAELTFTTGIANPEFATQVGDSHAAMAAITGAQAGARPPGRSRISRYIASEQSLTAGHRFHPAPKARPGRPGDWLPYAPEAGARFPLRFLAVRDDVAAVAGDTAALGALGALSPPPGYQVLPAHPWQFRLRAADADGWLRRALAAGLLLDLEEGDRAVAATSSVRTVYDPVADVFCKFSLGVRITNCVRTSAWYELAASV
ncbi:MAG: IucA/IucC family protein [Trebonia sp.]